MEKLDSQNRDKYIIERLRSSEVPVSGELMAGELGLSRVALWKRIEILKSWGFSIASSKRGYELERDDGLATWDMSVPGEIFLHDKISSTMDEARQQALRGVVSGSMVLANSQTAGRGRSGRTWTSPEGGLYFTLIIRPALPVTHAGAIFLETATILLGCLTGTDGMELRFRWPNDIMSAESKLGGILVECGGSPDKPDYYLVGVGLNSKAVRVEGRDSASFDSLTIDPPRRAHVAAETARLMELWAEKPKLDSGRWDSLLPDCKIKITAALWNGDFASGFPCSFGKKGELILDKGRSSLDFCECVKVSYKGEVS